ncbi:hypothetical protein STENM223S_05576 [Streptomyces tendae]
MIEHRRPQPQDESSPSPADSRRASTPSTASTTAISAMSSARRTTVPASPPDTTASTTLPARTGVATASSAVAIPSSTNRTMRRRCGRANAPMRRSVSRVKGRRSSSAFMTLHSCAHAVVSILMRMTLGPRPALRSRKRRRIRRPGPRVGHP